LFHLVASRHHFAKLKELKKITEERRL